MAEAKQLTWSTSNVVTFNFGAEQIGTNRQSRDIKSIYFNVLILWYYLVKLTRPGDYDVSRAKRGFHLLGLTVSLSLL